MINRFLIAAALSLTTASAGTIYSFTAGAGDPPAQGWNIGPGVLSGATVTDLGQTAWRMTGNNCCGYWFDNLSTAQWTEAFTLGWSLRATARTTGTSGIGFVFLDVPGNGNLSRFDISFGNDGTNGWAGLSAFTDFANPAKKTVFSGNGYHLLDMRWSPVTQSASLWVDGVLTLSGYTGHKNFREAHGPAFGVTGSTTQGFFQNVAFSINDPVTSTVPEPAAPAMLLMGFALIACRVRKRGGR